MLGPLLLTVAALVAATVVVVSWLDRSDRATPPPVPGFEVPELAPDPGSAVPTAAAVAPGAERTATRPTTAAVRDWAATLSDRTQIPLPVLVAYAEAELAVRDTAPDCNLSWSTLAGVGRVESHHGRYNGSDIGDDGRLTPPIIGIPLDGSPGVRAIPDTDGGVLDGDVTWDRAVGSMQFLPTTWDRWGTRANGDGQDPDPQNVNDAALAAARYLCASGGDLSTANGWWQAVLTYNRSVDYGQNVFSGADAYAKAANAS
ncbi:murein transglycosylase [Actinophytocola xinjiangensis]|uniref:Murein transglycosylase n=1 Tax=Actinophytocola xinjiangensis TaxID=485602 RepID=A0A7Z0WMN6_9PSEU|nr:murein transglycosylase [Actinophytocola xinjiangensis]